jgi:hypothetical protein
VSEEPKKLEAPRALEPVSEPVKAPATAPVAPPATVPATEKASALVTAPERRHDPEHHGRRQEDLPTPAGPLTESKLQVPYVTPGSRTENIVAMFLLLVLIGCGGIWIEHNRCPGALRTAVYAAAPFALAFAVPVSAFLAWGEKRASRADRTRRAVIFSIWAGAASLSLATATLLVWNERGPVVARTDSCLILPRETVPARDAGVQDWILVIQCSPRMSAVRIEVDREKWWTHEPGGTVQASLMRGGLGYDWVVDVPTLGQPKRSL